MATADSVQPSPPTPTAADTAGTALIEHKDGLVPDGPALQLAVGDGHPPGPTTKQGDVPNALDGKGQDGVAGSKLAVQVGGHGTPTGVIISPPEPEQAVAVDGELVQGKTALYVGDLLGKQAEGGLSHKEAPKTDGLPTVPPAVESGAAGSTTPAGTASPADGHGARPEPGMVKFGLHSISTNDQMEKTVFELAKEKAGLDTAGHVNAWSYARDAGTINADLEFLDLAAAGAPPGNPGPPVPIPAGGTDFAFRMNARWSERSSDGAPVVIDQPYDIRVTLPPGNIINERQVLYTDITFRSALGKFTEQIDAMKETSKGSSVLDSRTIGSAITSLLPQNTFGRSTEQLANLPIANRLRMARVVNSGMYARLLHQAAVLTCYEEMGLVPAFAAPAGVIGNFALFVDYDPLPAAVNASLDDLVTAAVTGQITFRVPLDLSPDEASLLISILANPASLFGVGAGQPVVPFAAVAWQRQAPMCFIKPNATVINWVAALPDAIQIWRLAEKVALLRGEVDDFIEGLALATELVSVRPGLDLLAPWAPAGSFTAVDASYSARMTEVCTPGSMNWISQMLPDNAPAVRNQAEFDAFNAMDVGERWLAIGRLGFLYSSAASTAFKEFNIYGVMLDMYSLTSNGRQWAGANRLEGQLLSKNNIVKPDPVGKLAPWIYRATEALMMDMYGVTWPSGTHDGKYWGGRAAGPGGVVPPPVPPAARSAVLYTQLFGNNFPTLCGMVAVINHINLGCIPRNWGLIGQASSVDLTKEVRTGAGASRGLLFYLGVKYAPAEFQSAGGGRLHSYAVRAGNVVSLFMAVAFPFTEWRAPVGPGNEPVWAPGAVGAIAPVRMPGGSLLVVPETLRSFDWQAGDQISYSLSFPPGAVFNSIAAIFQRQVVSGAGYMAFGLVRPYLGREDTAVPAGAEDWGADLF